MQVNHQRQLHRLANQAEEEMEKINYGRVLLGGLAAGLLMNVSEALLHGGVLGQAAVDLYQSLGVVAEPHPMNLAVLVTMTFLLGIGAVWLYAAIRPRFGPGVKTALCAGLAVWVLAHLWSGVYLSAGFAGLVTPKLAWTPVAWGLVEAPLATIVGAWLYRE